MQVATDPVCRRKQYSKQSLLLPLVLVSKFAVPCYAVYSNERVIEPNRASYAAPLDLSVLLPRHGVPIRTSARDYGVQRPVGVFQDSLLV